MNPELPQVRPSSETMPRIPGGVEYSPDGRAYSPEVAPTHERPTQTEQAPQPAAPPVAASDIAVPQVPIPAFPVPAPAQPVSDVPAVAADDDLIEKEWVDKLKKIIALTKGNPHEQAKAIAALQADYLKKRYNRNIGEAEEQSL